ncbi:hypothetical protein BESB_004530 [Besnoitia besnoiti]|uniref:Protein-lysine N-methyltransferase BESB_004530 n=1 Tax=Besnoitia besnoiti TaxID=94643 RepID=A0A2A9MQ81_BESBE|nr:hypothetical protein BESB_004530 [Besnoitia besnoiti]PFH38112.1 hypothetical protein BESB_004530 [Besnoitia besnoiti]
MAGPNTCPVEASLQDADSTAGRKRDFPQESDDLPEADSRFPLSPSEPDASSQRRTANELGTLQADSSAAAAAPESEEEKERVPLPASYAYWEDVYERELHLACEDQEEDDEDSSASAEERIDTDNSETDEGDGEEWFAAQSEAIADWLVASLEEVCSGTKLTAGDHPSRAAAYANFPRATNPRTERSLASDLPERGEMPKTHLEIPILDVGCGNGLFLLRLLRRGCCALAGVDYSAAAIQLARRNVGRLLLRKKGQRGRRQRAVRRGDQTETESPEEGGEAPEPCLDSASAAPASDASRSLPHVCLSLVDLRQVQALKAAKTSSAGARAHEASRSECLLGAGARGCAGCGSSSTSREQRNGADRPPDDGVSSPGRPEGLSGDTLAPLEALPQFSVIHDKGTFDVFYLLKTPEVYVQRIAPLLPAAGLLFLTSCNCTRDELEGFFCRSEQGTGLPLFEVVDQLRHKTFKFGGVEGQVVTTLLLARIGT